MSTVRGAIDSIVAAEMTLSHTLLSAKTQHKLNSHTLTRNELSLSTIHEGKAMPKVAALGPSGLPYFS